MSDIKVVYGTVLAILLGVILIGILGCKYQVTIKSIPSSFAKNVQVLAFTADWCQQCVRDKPGLAELQARGVDVVEIDVSENPNQVREYGVERIPTYVVLQDGVERNRTERIGTLLLSIF